MDNALAFRKDQRSLYFKDIDGWLPIQVLKQLKKNVNIHFCVVKLRISAFVQLFC